ncbi:MAG: DUF447 domain-containing protein [Halanaeroarchaeum sp.]
MRDWPVGFDGIAETVTVTPDPGDTWNVAALGVRAGDPATARTWGATNTRRNLERAGAAVVTFGRDPLLFVEAALTEVHRPDPVPETADAWARVEATAIGRGESGETGWVDWALEPTESTVERRTVPVTNRGTNAVIEMTVAASRLGVPTYDDGTLRDRLSYFEDVVETCGGEREMAALERLRDTVEW